MNIYFRKIYSIKDALLNIDAIQATRATFAKFNAEKENQLDKLHQLRQCRLPVAMHV